MGTVGEPGNRSYEFGPFCLDSGRHLLLRDGQPMPLTPKALETLLLLVERHGQVVEKDDLMKEIWPDVCVEEAGLARNISVLRKVLGEGPSDHEYIETVPRRGYRFVAPVREVSADARPPGRQPTGISGFTEVNQPQARTHEIHGGRRGVAQYVSTSKWTAIGVFLAAVAVTVFVLRDRVALPASQAPALRSIAVLPFRSLGHQRDESLEMGMAEAVIVRLSTLGQVTVRSASAVSKYADAKHDLAAAGQELKVDAVVGGTLQQAGDRIRVIVSLVRVRDGATLWGDKFDEDPADRFALQDAISERAARGLMPHVAGEDRKLLAKRYTENTAAHRNYVMGRHFANQRTEDDLKKGIDYFEKAVDLDPNYALARAGLADAYTLMSTYRVLPPSEAYRRAKAAAREALAMDNTIAEAHTTLGVVSFYYEWDWAAAERHFKEAIALKPADSAAHQRYALCLMWVGRFDEARAEIKQAQELDPVSLIVNANVGQVLYNARRYDEAIDEFLKALELNPSFFQAHRLLAQTYVQQRLYDQAIREFTTARPGGGVAVEAELGHAYGVSGNTKEARKILTRLKDPSIQGHVPAFDIGLVHLGLGETDQAFAWLEKSYDQRERWMMTLKVNPVFDSLRSDGRFTDLMQRIGLDK